MIGPQEPPNNPVIFNRRRPDGTFPPLSEFFDGAVIRNLNSRRDQIIGRLATTIPGTEDAKTLCHELAEIDIELERVG